MIMLNTTSQLEQIVRCSSSIMNEMEGHETLYMLFNIILILEIIEYKAIIFLFIQKSIQLLFNFSFFKIILILLFLGWYILEFYKFSKTEYHDTIHLTDQEISLKKYNNLLLLSCYCSQLLIINVSSQIAIYFAGLLTMICIHFQKNTCFYNE